MGGKTRKIVIQLVLRQCCKTSCTFFVARFSVPLAITTLRLLSAHATVVKHLWGNFVDQEEREYAMRSFREGKKDVMVATDVASKGLDFPDIQHVINFDMPEDIENYGTDRVIFLSCSWPFFIFTFFYP